MGEGGERQQDSKLMEVLFSAQNKASEILHCLVTGVHVHVHNHMDMQQVCFRVIV